MRRDTLTEAADRLHEEGLEAIRSGSPGRYEDVLDAYEEALLAFPAAWARYGQRFDSQAAQGLNPLGISQTEGFLRNLGVELSEAVVSDIRDVAFAAAFMPSRIARRAFSLDAIELSKRVLNLLTLVYRAAARAPAIDVAGVIKEKVWRHLYEFAIYILASRVKDRETDLEERRKASEFLRQVFDTYNNLLKQMLEQQDLETLREADRYWSRIMAHWAPEHEEPFEELVDDMTRELGEDDPRVKEAQLKAETKRQMVSIKEELFNLRAAYRYGLCFWALRRLREAENPGDWVPIFEYFASRFKNVEQIVRVAGLALAAESEDTVPWSDWMLFDLPEGEAHFIGVDPEILRVLVTLMLLSVDLEARASSIGPQEWMPVRLEQTERLLDEVLQDEALRDHLLPEEERLQERAEVLREALRRSAREQKELEEQKIRESALSREKLESFRSSLREGWLENRLVAPLFQLASSYEEIPEPPTSSEGWFGIDEWLPKDMFVPESQIFGAESIAHQFGFSLTEGEVRELLAKLSDSPGEGEDRGPFPEKVQATLRKMADEGYIPSVILAPLSWRLVRDMGIEGGPRSRTNSTSPEGIPPEATRNNFRGRIDGVPVFELLRTSKDRVWIIDLAAFATWRQWIVDEEGGQLRIEFEDFDEEQALKLATENPNMLRNSEIESVADRAAAIRSRVYLRIRERFEIIVEDQTAARWLEVPEELR